jgi:O-acetyl-ADP-ribose deacetylase (regulator of RNase III)
MIQFTTGDILKCDAEAVVNTVNCVGVMGRGLALQFKNAFPQNFKAYAAACTAGEVRPGHMFVFETGQLLHPRYIVNFPTKRHWGDPSLLADIETGLTALCETVRLYNIRSIAVPPLGCGLGGLAWSEIRPRIEATMQPHEDVRVIIFEADGAPSEKDLDDA